MKEYLNLRSARCSHCLGSSDWVLYAYELQIANDPFNIPQFLQALYTISQAPGISSLDRDALGNQIHIERSKQYWMADDLPRALTQLGFGDDGPIGIDFDADVDAKFLMMAYSNSYEEIQQRFSGLENGPQGDQKVQALINLKESVVIAAQSTGREDLVAAVLEHLERRKDPNAAYRAIDVSPDVDDGLLLTIYSVRVSARWLRRRLRTVC